MGEVCSLVGGLAVFIVVIIKFVLGRFNEQDFYRRVIKRLFYVLPEDYDEVAAKVKDAPIAFNADITLQESPNESI